MKELWQLPPALEPAARRLVSRWSADSDGGADADAAPYREKQDQVGLAPRGMNVKKFMCWIWGHDRMQTTASQRVCLRCGQRETLRQFGSTPGWEELPDSAR